MEHNNLEDPIASTSADAAALLDDSDKMSLVIDDENFVLSDNTSICASESQLVDSSPTPSEDNSTPKVTHINDLPDELLENIFTRVSPYDDFDSLKCVCRKWHSLAQNVVNILRNTFKQSLQDGTLECVKKSASLNEKGFIVQPWISERFGHMCCYCDKKIYVCGGTTHTPTTFNDLWSFDLSKRVWSRVIASGQYPSPKALGSFVKHRKNLVLFGGWSHPSPYPLMQPWRIFDELHIYDSIVNKWTLQETFNGPPPTAGHSATVHGDVMIIFGGRTFDQENQSFPLSGAAWVYDFKMNHWYKMKTVGDFPLPRYGQTQIELDDTHLLVIGGCGGPNQIMSDVWLLTMTVVKTKIEGTWTLMTNQSSDILDFHYKGCKVGSYVVFFERSSPISPFLAFLHFDSKTHEQHGELFQRTAFQSKCSSGLKNSVINTTMPLYALDISKVLSQGRVEWLKTYPNGNMTKLVRPDERLLYTAVPGRCEIILFGGFYKDPNADHCRVSSDIYFIGTQHKTY